MKRPLVFAALLLVSVILLLSAFGLPLTKIVRERTFLKENETRKGMLYGRLSRLSPSAGGWRLVLEEAEFEESAEGAVNAASEAAHMSSGLRHVGTVLVYAGSEPEAPIGSLMRIRGSISLFPEPDNPGEFDQRAYYRVQNILLRMSAEEVTAGAGQGAAGTNPSGVMRAAYRFREAARRVRSTKRTSPRRGLYSFVQRRSLTILWACRTLPTEQRPSSRRWSPLRPITNRSAAFCRRKNITS